MQTILWNSISSKEQQQLIQRTQSVAFSKETQLSVQNIINAVKNEGLDSLIKYTKQFDYADFVFDNLIQTCDEQSLSEKEKDAILQAIENISKFHNVQLAGEYELETMPGVRCKRVYRPIQSVGLYIPGGTAPLVSTVLMMAIPARLANCEKVILCTPPDSSGKINPAILYAAKMCGINQVFAIGGAQAIAAMAYGCGPIPKVNKIFGPGNQYVNLAKIIVSQEFGGPAIDMPAGPSEVLVIADETARPEFVAADLLSQAEHDTLASVITLTFSEQSANAIRKETENQLKDLPRKAIASKALQNAQIIIMNDIYDALDLSNQLGPEHLIIQVNKADSYLDKIINAGSVFIGEWTPEAVGDYASGTNHVLPTSGYASKMGGLNLDSFRRSMTVQNLDPQGLINLAPCVETLASMESLEAHRRAVSIRREVLEKGL
ncbi:MAG: histidinol dehydrogenase [bacterium]|nr:histidinol dehydrogenase [bacterium]